MEPVRKIIAGVMRSLAAGHDADPQEQETVERWLYGVLITAAINKAGRVVIRPARDGTALEVILENCASSDGGYHIRKLNARHAVALEALLMARSGELVQTVDGQTRYGRFEDSVGSIRFTVDAYCDKRRPDARYVFLIRYQEQ